MKRAYLLICYFACILCLHAQDRVHTWSFGNGSNSDDGAIIMKLRGTSQLGKDANGSYLLVNSDGKKAAGIIAEKPHPDLSPEGAFRAEFTFVIDALPENNQWFNFFDNQYVNYKHANKDFNRGLQLYFKYFSSGQQCYPGMSIGLGDGSSAEFSGKGIRLESGKIHTIAFCWDGRKTAEFYLDGKLNRRVTHEKKIKMAPAVYSAVIGDRWSSGYNPFPGRIYGVTFAALEASGIDLTANVTGRKVFLRNERGACLQLSLENEEKESLSGIVVTCDLGAGAARTVEVGEIAPGGKRTVQIPVETCLTPGSRSATIVINCTMNGKAYKNTLKCDYGIAPLVGDRMPAVMWGGSISHKTLCEYGFTHRMGYMFSGFFTRRAKERYEVLNELFQQFDDYLMDGFRAVDFFNIMSINDYPLLGMDGKPATSTPRIDPVDPQAQKLVAQIADEATRAFGVHPAVEATNLNNETRDGSRPGFADHNRKLWKEFSGSDIPDFVKGRLPPSWILNPNFPTDRVIAESDPVFRFYKWWWTKGDGWNSINEMIHGIYKANFKHNVMTFHDPAVRVPPFWGSGGNIDCISHWTYGNPDPINVGVVSSELSAMAKGYPGQKIMNMTQVIVYRSETAPRDSKADPPKGLKEHPDAVYITLPPDMMCVALWTQLSRQGEAFMIFGQNALFPNPDPKGTYQCTNDETREVVKDILHNVIRPFGPVLRRLPERPAEIAILESGASAMYAERATMGWTGWPFQLHLGMLWANLQPRVIYEEEIERDGFGGIKVLVMPHCDVLTEGAARKIQAFQQRGGIVAADSCVAPAIIPDFDINVIPRVSKKPLETKQALQAEGLKLRRNLAEFCTPYVETSDADLVTWVRSSGKADYLFIVNDKRCAGNYMGQYGLILDKGMPASGTVTVNRKCGIIYDLIQQKTVPFTVTDGRTTIPVAFEGAGGKMLLLLPQEVASPTLAIPESVGRGKTAVLSASLQFSSGKPVESIHPLRIKVMDSNGNETDDSGFAALVNGKYTQSIIIPEDAPLGSWTVEIQELASGKRIRKQLTVSF